MVSYYGVMTPLQQLANVSAPEARLLVIQPYDASTIPEIEKEIQKSDLKNKLEKLSGNSVDMEFSVDTKLIGGIVVKMDDKLFDGSLKKRLQEIKEAIDS